MFFYTFNVIFVIKILEIFPIIVIIEAIGLLEKRKVNEKSSPYM